MNTDPLLVLDRYARNARAPRPDPVADATTEVIGRGYFGEPPLPHQAEAMHRAAKLIGQAPTTVSGNHKGWPEVTGDFHVHLPPRPTADGRLIRSETQARSLEKRLKKVMDPLGHTVDVVRDPFSHHGHYSVYVRAHRLPFALKPETTSHSEYPAVRAAVLKNQMPAGIAADWLEDQGEPTAAARLRSERDEWAPGLFARWRPTR